jgi:hypothetical protein
MFGKLRSGYYAVFAVSGVLLAAALILGDRPVFYYLDFVASRRGLALCALPPLLWLSWIGILVTKRRLERPTLAIYRMVRRNRYWLLRGTVLVALAPPVAKAFSVIKRSIPDIVPFYADSQLAYADRVLFFGLDAWQVTHAVLGPISTLLIDRLYLLWFPMMVILNAWYAFTRDQRLQIRGLLTYILAWGLLGNVFAMGLSSVGPCFYELFYGSTHFRPLMDTLRDYDSIYGIKAFRTMNWLYESRDKDRFGSGISAMPSLHVAISFLTYLTTRYAARSRWLVGLAGAYALLIFIGSIHLGWHYAVDGIVSVIGVSIIWWTAGRFVDSLDRKDIPASALNDAGKPPVAVGA